MSARRRVWALVLVGVLAAASGTAARAVDAGQDVTCTPVNGGDRSTSLLTPGSTLNQLSLWVTADAGPDAVGVHVEPWHRQAYFADAGVSTTGEAGVAASVDGDDGEGPGYVAGAVGADGACAASPTAGIGATTGGSSGASPSRVAVVAGPGAASVGYATRTVPVVAGDGADFVNADTASHDVISVDRDALGRPVFRSPFLGFGASAPVAGVEQLAPGTYAFYCSVHPNMGGSIVVQQLAGSPTS